MEFIELSPDRTPREKRAFEKLDALWADQAAEMCRRGWFRGRQGVLAAARRQCKNSRTLGSRGVLAFVYSEFSEYCRARAWSESGMLAGIYWIFTAWLYGFAASYSSNMVEEMLGGFKKLNTTQLVLRAELLLVRGEYQRAGACAEEGLRRRRGLTMSQGILLKCVLAECLVLYRENKESCFLYKELGNVVVARHKEVEPQVLIAVYCSLARRTLQLHRGGFNEEEAGEEAGAFFQRAIRVALENRWDAEAFCLRTEAEQLCPKKC